MQNIGPIAYLAGLGVSVIAGFVPSLTAALPVGLILLGAGLAVGALNVTKEENNRFLIALLFLPVTAVVLAQVPTIGTMLS